MTGEHDGIDPEERSEDYRMFRRLMDGLGHEGLRQMIEHLTEAIEANPHDTEVLSARGLVYGELGDHRRAAEDYGSVIALDPDNAGAYLDRARTYSELRHVPADFTAEEIERWSMVSDVPGGRLGHLSPVLQLSETQPYWARPSVPLGYHEPVWPERSARFVHQATPYSRMTLF